jgi:CMP-N,N'-diacetyllegionaminic acid synthase
VAGAVALVPARGGSVRVPGKNIAPLAGHPLLAYSIAAARESGRFDAIVVSTDRDEIADVARRYGAEVIMRPAAMATATSSDIEWVRHALDGTDYDVFSILRPTSPFRRGATINRAWERFGAHCSSVRAVRRVREHPGKMWVRDGEYIRPLLPQPEGETPTHSRQTAALPEVWVQDSSLEIAWTRIVADGEIAGPDVVPFFPERHEGFSIDYPDELAEAERLAAAKPELLPPIEVIA